MGTKPGHSAMRCTILKAGAAVVAADRAGLFGGATHVARGQDQAGNRGGESKGAASFVLKSQTLPEPKVTLPTDAHRRRAGPSCGLPRSPRRTSSTRMPMTLSQSLSKAMPSSAGRTSRMPRWASLAIEQFPPSDIGRGLAARYGIPIFDTPAAALGLGRPGGLWPWTV